MGRHSVGRHPYEDREPKTAGTDRLVASTPPAVPSPSELGPDEDTNVFQRVEPARFWEPEPAYEPTDERPRLAAWALALCAGVVLVIVAVVAFMFGAGHADEKPKVIFQTETVTPSPSVVTVTPKSQAKPAKALKPSISIRPGPVVYRTRLLPAPVQTRTVTVTKTAKPKIIRTTAPAEVRRECYDQFLDRITCP